MDNIIDNREIGQKIRKFRLAAGLTQEGLAERLEITFQQVQKYERGVTKVNLVKLQQISKILKVPVAAFFQDSTILEECNTASEVLLLTAFREIKEDHLKASVVDIVTSLSKNKS